LIKRAFLPAGFFLFTVTTAAWAQAGGGVLSASEEQTTRQLPVIESLTHKDAIFETFMTEVQKAYQSIARDKHFAPLLFEYTAAKGDTVFTVSSRCAIPYDTLATINRLDSADAPLEGMTLVIPAAPGLFIPEIPNTTTEYLITQRYVSLLPDVQKLLVNDVVFLYNKRDKFSAEERVFFVDSTMKLPLASVVLTSAFGLRKSPITGAWQHHNGVDLGAPTGTEVFSCKGGVVSFAGTDSILGKYVIITHANNMQSLYAHLSKIRVETGKTVQTGTIIGEVGATGAVTGPHLHFEIRVGGKAQDPRDAVKGLR
jgi:murein DD-endopeptidase MepM/ murein hydrolase activator NlpD